jgi:hypothetical protein
LLAPTFPVFSIQLRQHFGHTSSVGSAAHKRSATSALESVARA